LKRGRISMYRLDRMYIVQSGARVAHQSELRIASAAQRDNFFAPSNRPALLRAGGRSEVHRMSRACNVQLLGARTSEFSSGLARTRPLRTALITTRVRSAGHLRCPRYRDHQYYVQSTCAVCTAQGVP
jgi:hypothetical protein